MTKRWAIFMKGWVQIREGPKPEKDVSEAAGPVIEVEEMVSDGYDSWGDPAWKKVKKKIRQRIKVTTWTGGDVICTVPLNTYSAVTGQAKGPGTCLAVPTHPVLDELIEKWVKQTPRRA